MNSNAPDWKLLYAHRTEHFFVGPRRGGRSSIVAALKEHGYWALDYCGEQTGPELQKLYTEQCRLPGAPNSPRIFFSDGDWFRLKGYFHFVKQHLKADISFPELVLERALSHEGHPMDIDWLYLNAADARERLIPELAVAGLEASYGLVDPASKSLAARKVAADFLRSVYPELVPALVWVAPGEHRASRMADRIRLPISTFLYRVRSFRSYHKLPYGLTATQFVEYLIACGLCQYSNRYYVTFAPIFGLGLAHLKNELTHAAIKEMLPPE